MSNDYRRPVSNILKRIVGAFKEQQNKAHQILAMLLARNMYENFAKYKNFEKYSS